MSCPERWPRAGWCSSISADTIGARATACVSPDADTTYTLTTTGPGGSVTATVSVTVTHCRGITAVSGGGPHTPGTIVACPTGATEFCESVPLDEASSGQAADACEACYGAGQCWGGGSAWMHSGGAAFIFSQIANGSCIGMSGDITNGWYCPSSRWAP